MTSSTEVAHDLNRGIRDIPMPPAIERLPVHRGFPVPWFVAWVDGVPEFRAADGRKMELAIRERRCWVCGDVLRRRATFVIGPMCVVNRTTAEPPSHMECGVYSALACPFLSCKQMERRENDMPAGSVDAAGFMIRRNPEVTILWETRHWSLFDDGRGGTLFRIGAPARVFSYCRGRRATQAEILRSIETGLPALEKLARQEGPEAVHELQRMTREANTLLTFSAIDNT